MEEAAGPVADTPKQLIARFPKYFTISILAKRNQGKTYLMTQIIKELKAQKKVDKVVILSGTAGFNTDYHKVVDPTMIFQFSEQILQNIWALQASIKEDEREHIFVVLDDCLASADARNSEMVDKLYTTSRHLQISLAVLSQYGSFLLTPLRLANSDIILWCKLNVRGLEKLWLTTSGIAKDKFIEISNAYSNGNFQYMLLDNYIRSPNVADQLSFVKAP